MPLFKKIFPIFALCAVCAMAESSPAEFQRFSAVPVLGYTEETELQCGAMILLFLKPDADGKKIPEIGFTAYGSSRGQLQIVLEPFLYLYRDKISVWFDLEYQDWVASYFGSGNDPDIDRFTNYNRKKLYFGTKIEARLGLPEAFKYGIELHVEHSDIEFDRDGKIRPPDPHSGRRNGAGYLIALDTRDNTNWTRHGFLAEWKQLFFSGYFGDYRFDVESLDLRGYTELPWEVSAATGFLWKRTNGDVPFDMLAGPDGIKRFRGVESLYFNGNQAVILQSELRRHIAWIFGAHLFFEGGKAGDYFGELLRNKWHRAVGFGGLLALNRSESLFARADVSWVDFDHIGLSFYVRQAF